MPNMPDTQTPATTSEWGLTTDHETAIYSTKGKLLGHISAGNMLIIHKRKNTSEGDFLECTIIKNGKKHKNMIIKSEHAIIYNCNLADITPEQRKLSIQHAKLLGQISKREAQLKKDSTDKNPYAAKYKSALANYKQTAKKNNSLLKAYNNATGPRRMELADQLRLIKHNSEETKKEYTAAKKQYKTWKSQNSSYNIDFGNDSQIHKLQQQIATIENKLSNP